MINDPFEEVVILEGRTSTFSWLVILVIKFWNGAQADSLVHH
jgi:hypothetical protein